MRAFILAVTGFAFAVAACSSSGTSVVEVQKPAVSQVASVEIAINPAAVVVGQRANALVTLRDAIGNALTGRVVTWQSNSPAIATVSANGEISTAAPGTAAITATAEGKTASASLSVSAAAPVPVARIEISPASSNLQVGGTVQLSATTRDASGAVLTGRAIAWSSVNAGIASVSSNGLVTAVSAGSTLITASSEGISSSATITTSAPAPVPVVSVSVTPASSTVQVGGTVQLTATLRDANNNILSGRQITWSSSTPTNATVDTAGLVSALSSGSVTITAASEGRNGSAAVTISSPPPPPGASPLWRGNEPSGMTPVSDRHFNSLAEGSWWTMTQPGATIVTDATAPQSPSNVVQFNFDAGDAGGVSPEFTELSHTGYRIIYIAYWVKHSSNWQGHLTGINKHGYVWHNTENPYFVYTSQGAGSDPLKLRIALQTVAVQPNADGWYTQNVDPTKTFTRGSWDLVEMVLRGNAANTTNGSMDFYLNGAHVSSYTGIRFHATDVTKWDFTRIYPVWGGGGDRVTSNMGLSFDHFYVSGKN